MPFEMPDRRAAFVLIGLVTMSFIHVASLALLGEGIVARLTEWVLYGSIALAGVVLGFLSFRDGFSLLKPSHTRTDAPFSFWVEVAFLVLGLPATASHFALNAP